MKFLYNLFINKNLSRSGYVILLALNIPFVVAMALFSFALQLCYFCNQANTATANQNSFEAGVLVLIYSLVTLVYMTVRRLNDIGRSFVEMSILVFLLLVSLFISFAGFIDYSYQMMGVLQIVSISYIILLVLYSLFAKSSAQKSLVQ